MGEGLQALRKFLDEKKDDVIVLADKHTLADCYPLLLEDVPHFIVPYGETYKNIDSCEYIWKMLTQLGATRKSILVCLGGGVLCDMGAYAATCYQRGMRVALVPTSLLAMVDAAVGGKNGVNFMGLKNYVGTFREPDYSFTCPEFLKTLPAHEMTNGYVEMLKHGLIADKAHYDAVKMYFLNNNLAMTEELIQHSITIKKNHVAQDFKDNGVRKRLNFGHTVGHAIESYSVGHSDENEAFSHGVSVALGILAECYLSAQLVGFSEEALHEVSIVLQPILSSLNNDIPTFEQIRPYLLKDKKNTSDKVNFSLLKSIGDCEHDHEVELELVKQSIDYLVGLV